MLRRYIAVFSVILLTAMMSFGVTACGVNDDGASTEPGTIKAFVTDAPADEEVTAVLVTVSGIAVHRAVAEQEEQRLQDSGNNTAVNPATGNITATDNVTPDGENQVQEQEDQVTGEWITLDIGEGLGTFDLLQVMGVNEFMADGLVSPGKYTQVRLIIDKVEVTLGEAAPVEAKLPSGELKLVSPFDVIAGETTSLIIDFDAAKSVTVTGSGEIIFKPVVKLITEKGDVSQGQSDDGNGEGQPDNTPAATPVSGASNSTANSGQGRNGNR